MLALAVYGVVGRRNLRGGARDRRGRALAFPLAVRRRSARVASVLEIEGEPLLGREGRGTGGCRCVGDVQIVDLEQLGRCVR